MCQFGFVNIPQSCWQFFDFLVFQCKNCGVVIIFKREILCVLPKNIKTIIISFFFFCTGNFVDLFSIGYVLYVCTYNFFLYIDCTTFIYTNFKGYIFIRLLKQIIMTMRKQIKKIQNQQVN